MPRPAAPGERPTLTKIIATIGPASEPPDMIAKLIRAGVNVFRLNFSHGTLDEHARRLAQIRSVADEIDAAVAVLGDLQGPKIRVGKLPDTGVVVHTGLDCIFKAGIDEAATIERDGQKIPVLPITYEPLVREVEPGHRVLVNDGFIRMLAVDRDEAAGELRCRVTFGGLITTGKGINLPQSTISAPAITDRDWECVAWAVKHGLDFLALSFVRRGEEVRKLTEHLANICPPDRELMEAGKHRLPVIAKIEKPQAVDEIEDIVDAADAIMVARGDLGVEMDLPQVPVIQKRLIAECKRYGKPCIVATQMLETMVENATPTRAEVSDVANAIFDGAGVVMLSAESAVGRHPDLVVETMERIAGAAESRIASEPHQATPPQHFDEERAQAATLAHGAWYIAESIGAELVVVWSQSGESARFLSQTDFTIPIVAYTSNPRAARRMALLRGVTAIHREPPKTGTLAEWNAAVDEDLIQRGWATVGTPIVMLGGKPLGKPLSANLVAIHRVGTPGGFLFTDTQEPATNA